MSESIRIQLSKTTAIRFAEREAAIAAMQAKKNEDVTTLLAQACEPEQFAQIIQAQWSITLSDSAIVCSPPQILAAGEDEPVVGE